MSINSDPRSESDNDNIDNNFKRYINCWACHVTLEIPIVQGQYAEKFTCGICSAMTELTEPKKKYFIKASFCNKFLDSISKFTHILSIIFVLFILASITIIGYIMVIPNAFKSQIALNISKCLTFILIFNIAFNYLAAAIISSKNNCHELPLNKDKTISKGAYQGYRYCIPCQKAKPPEVHHCSICRQCVIDMDHHCPFIGNCVGRDNLRNFLLFLIWAAMGSIYAIIICVTALIRVWKPFDKRSFKRDFTLFKAFKTMLFPFWVYAAFYIVFICFAGGIGVMLLLFAQLNLVLSGHTYIDKLKNEDNENSKSNYKNLSKVFGFKSVFLWFCPYWGSPKPYYYLTYEKES